MLSVPGTPAAPYQALAYEPEADPDQAGRSLRVLYFSVVAEVGTRAGAEPRSASLAARLVHAAHTTDSASSERRVPARAALDARHDSPRGPRP